jgi:hypothetical protein
MMTPMSRVFFGFPATDVPRKTPVGTISMAYKGHSKPGYTLKFAHNSMDELNLPIPGHDGPSNYDNESLLFTKRPKGVFELSVGTAKNKANWIARSKAIGADHKMSSGRKWGVW